MGITGEKYLTRGFPKHWWLLSIKELYLVEYKVPLNVFAAAVNIMHVKLMTKEFKNYEKPDTLSRRDLWIKTNNVTPVECQSSFLLFLLYFICGDAFVKHPRQRWRRRLEVFEVIYTKMNVPPKFTYGAQKLTYRFYSNRLPRHLNSFTQLEQRK